MLIVALVLAVISLAALVTAVVTSNEMIAWACIGFSALGVLLLIVDAIRDRNRRPSGSAERPGLAERPLIPAPSTSGAVPASETTEVLAPDDRFVAEEFHEQSIERSSEARYPDEDADEESVEDSFADSEEQDVIVEDYPEEVVYDDPEHDEPSDDEPDYPVAAEEAAVHTISAEEFLAQHDSDIEAESDMKPVVERDESGSYIVVYPGESPDEGLEEPSYIVTESPTVSYAESPEGSADDSVIVIYSSETETGQSEDSEEPGGER